MKDYLYDGTFEGLLTCIHAHYYEEKAAGIYEEQVYQASMLQEARVMETDPKRADTVYRAIAEKISRPDLRRVYKAFRSTVPERENKILHYLRLGFSRGSVIHHLHGNPIVFAVQEAEGKVNREIDKWNGLLRFTVLGNRILYGPMEPEHDMIEFLAGHFCDRYKNEPFIIHDLRRKKAVIHAALDAGRSDWYISAFDVKDLPDGSVDEERYRHLWQDYFDTIAIRERINPDLQRNCMPKKYWKHLTEKLTMDGSL